MLGVIEDRQRASMHKEYWRIGVNTNHILLNNKRLLKNYPSLKSCYLSTTPDLPRRVPGFGLKTTEYGGLPLLNVPME